jgi:hypothetical protein
MRVLLGRLLRRDAGRGCDELIVVIFLGAQGGPPRRLFLISAGSYSTGCRAGEPPLPSRVAVLPRILESDTMKPGPPGHLGVACQNRT